uniref:Uncharacterized protein n=1 Tax=Rhizophora mucronata TaxID=61149 RepID=A0A2P2R0Z4_RHIMU
MIKNKKGKEEQEKAPST